MLRTAPGFQGAEDVHQYQAGSNEAANCLGYFNCLEMLPNVVLRLTPTPSAIITTAIPAAINPYSIAVAPDVSLQNRPTR